MIFWINTGILVITIVIEMTIANLLNLYAIKPDLMLVVVISMAFYNDSEKGAIIGFAGGLLKDLFSVHFLGVNALVKTVVGYLSGVIRDRIFSYHLLWIVAIFTFGFSLVNNLIVYILLSALHSNYDFVHILSTVSLWQAVINACISPFVFLGLKKIFSITGQRD